MKKIIITFVTFCLIVMVGTTLSNKSPSGRVAKDRTQEDRKSLKQDGRLDDGSRQLMQEGTSEQRTAEKSKVKKRLAEQREGSERSLSARTGSVVPSAPFYYSPGEQTIPQIDDPNLPKILTKMYFTNQLNSQKIRALEDNVKLLEGRLAKLEANEKKNFYQQKRLENQLKLLKDRRY